MVFVGGEWDYWVGFSELIFGQEPLNLRQMAFYHGVIVELSDGRSYMVYQKMRDYFTSKDERIVRNAEEYLTSLKVLARVKMRPMSLGTPIILDAKELMTLPKEKRGARLLEIFQEDPKAFKALSEIPVRQNVVGEATLYELHESLQPLADILAAEAVQAVTAEYYPPMNKWELSPEHVEKVAKAMQQELVREARRRGKQPVLYENLPYERKYALAERRRYWFYKFGITKREWEKNSYSLWNIPDEPFPEEFLPYRTKPSSSFPNI